VGPAILRPLQDLDEVAYMRFASVYRGFESLADFEEEIVVKVLDVRRPSVASLVPAPGGTHQAWAHAWETIRYAINDTARTVRLCVILLVLGLRALPPSWS
jgi:hypothetical protein